MFISSLSRSKGSNSRISPLTLWLVSRSPVAPDPKGKMGWLIALNNNHNNYTDCLPCGSTMCLYVDELSQNLPKYFKWGTIIVPILSVPKLEYRDTDQLSQGQTGSDGGFETWVCLPTGPVLLVTLRGEWSLGNSSRFWRAPSSNLVEWVWPLLNSGLNSGSSSYCVALDKVFNLFCWGQYYPFPKFVGRIEWNNIWGAQKEWRRCLSTMDQEGLGGTCSKQMPVCYELMMGWLWESG